MLGALVESSPNGVRRRLSALSVSAHLAVLAAVAFAARPVRGEPEPDRKIIGHPATAPPAVCVA